MRINKFIAACGICSRRKAEEYILQGRVKVNGIVISDLYILVNEKVDKICIDNKLVKLEDKKIYLMLNFQNSLLLF